MKSAMPDTEYPKVVTQDEFKNLVSRLSAESSDKKPDVSIAYQPIPDGIRILGIGSLNDCAKYTGNALRQFPEMRQAKVRSMFVRVPASRFRCL